MNNINIMNLTNEVFIKENSLLDTVLEEVLITASQGEPLKVGLTFSNFRKSSKFSRIRLDFREVKEYNFSYQQDYIFYNVENFKLLFLSTGIYLSLDPDETVEGKSDRDLDYIQAQKVELTKL